jgi:hypothetical protein
MIKVEKVDRKGGRVIRLEILFDNYWKFVFCPDKDGKPKLVTWTQIPNNSRYWLRKIWARAHAIFQAAEDKPEHVSVIEDKNSQLILNF